MIGNKTDVVLDSILTPKIKFMFDIISFSYLIWSMKIDVFQIEFVHSL